MWDKAHPIPDDPSDLLVEGYQEPRRDPESDELYVAVVATAMQSTRPHNERRLAQLQEALEEAREGFRRASQEGGSKKAQQAKAAAFVKASDRLKSFLERHPELVPPPEESREPRGRGRGLMRARHALGMLLLSLALASLTGCQPCAGQPGPRATGCKTSGAGACRA